jgi:hypothetical protein
VRAGMPSLGGGVCSAPTVRGGAAQCYSGRWYRVVIGTQGHGLGMLVGGWCARGLLDRGMGRLGVS